MQTSVVKFIALLLLLSQSWMGLARGQNLCFELAPCDAHEVSSHAGCGHDALDETAHVHGIIDLEQHEHPDCGCHLHLTVPNCELARFTHEQTFNVDAALIVDAFVPSPPLLDTLVVIAAAARSPDPPDKPLRMIFGELRGLRATVLVV